MTKINDLTNTVFERLTVINFAYLKNHRAYWNCKCSCGKLKIALGKTLVSGFTKSCGCLNKELASKNRTEFHSKIKEGEIKHPRLTHGYSKEGVHYIYKLWSHIKERCYNPNYRAYKYWGGRGITMYEPWINSFKLFKDYILDNLGHRPIGKTSIDRYPNNNGNYEPGNLRWADAFEQRHNRNPDGYLEEGI
jgi:hypothetical protein